MRMYSSHCVLCFQRITLVPITLKTRVVQIGTDPDSIVAQDAPAASGCPGPWRV